MKKIVVIILLIGMGLLVSCSKYTMTPKESLDQFIRTMKAYEAEVEVTFQTNEKSSIQKMRQTYDMNGAYTLTVLEPEHLEGYTTTYDGSRIIEYDPKQNKSVPVQPNPVRNQVLFGTFVHNYLQLENAIEAIGETDTTLYIVQDIPGNYKYMAKQKVQFEKTTRLPLDVVVYDQENHPTIIIKFLSFKSQP